MSETKTLVVQVYRDPKGQPTCCRDVTEGQVCKFLRTEFFGTRDVCSILDVQLFRDTDWTGWVRPWAACPLWGDS